MPLTAKGEKIKSALTKEYGEKKGESVLYAGKNKGTFSGIDEDGPAGAGSKDLPHLDADKVMRLMDGVSNLAHRFDAICSHADADESHKNELKEKIKKLKEKLSGKQSKMTSPLGVKQWHDLLDKYEAELKSLK